MRTGRHDHRFTDDAAPVDGLSDAGEVLEGGAEAALGVAREAAPCTSAWHLVVAWKGALLHEAAKLRLTLDQHAVGETKAAAAAAEARRVWLAARLKREAEATPLLRTAAAVVGAVDTDVAAAAGMHESDLSLVDSVGACGLHCADVHIDCVLRHKHGCGHGCSR